MNEKKAMKYEFAKLSLNGVIYVAIQSAMDSVATLFLPKSSRKAMQNLSKIGMYMITEIIAGGLGAVVDENVDGIKKHYSKMEDNECQMDS